MNALITEEGNAEKPTSSFLPAIPTVELLRKTYKSNTVHSILPPIKNPPNQKQTG